MYIAVQWSLTPMVFTGMVETTTKRLNLMKKNNELASQNARASQKPKETRNEDFFEIDIMKEFDFLIDECEETTELSNFMFNL